MDYKELVENARKCLGKCHGAQSAMALLPQYHPWTWREGGRGHSHPQLSGLADSPRRHGYAVRKRETDTRLSLFGHSFAYPFFAGPVGAVCHALQ